MKPIVFAYVDYQEKVISNYTLDKNLKEQLKTAVFPSYPSVDFKSQKKYEGIKVIPILDYVCISKYANLGKKDRFGRPILSSFVILLKKEIFNVYGRDVVAVIKFINQKSILNRSVDEFVQFIKQNSILYNPQVFHKLIHHFSMEFVVRALSCLTEKKKVVIFYNNLNQALNFVRIMYALFPMSIIMNKSFSTDCAEPASEYSEEIILVPYNRMKLKSLKKIPFVDLVNRKSCKGGKISTLKAIIAEIFSSEEWLFFSWFERYLILMKYLDCKIRNEKISLTDLSSKIRKIVRMAEKIQKLERL